ncbi:lipocalin family protein [Hymenobacter daeguensis]
MKNLRYLLLPALLSVAASCKKDNESPSKTAMLTGVTWKETSQTMTINGVAGNYTPAAADVSTYQFGSDGKLTITEGTAAPQTGTWAFTNNESQLTLTGAGNPTQTFTVFTLTSGSLSFGLDYNQAQVTAALAPSSTDVLRLLILGAGSFTFPANTPTVTPSQLTSFRYQTNLVPR